MRELDRVAWSIGKDGVAWTRKFDGLVKCSRHMHGWISQNWQGWRNLRMVSGNLEKWCRTLRVSLDL